MEKLAYGHSMEALLAAVKPVLDRELIAELQGLGLDPLKPILPSYSVDVARPAVAACAKRFRPDLSEGDAYFALGRRFVERYADTMIGRALLAASRLLGPRRMLDRAAKQFRTANNYLEIKVSHVREGHSELWLSEVAHASWFAGILSAMMDHAGARDHRVEVTRNNASGAVFVIQWQA